MKYNRHIVIIKQWINEMIIKSKRRWMPEEGLSWYFLILTMNVDWLNHHNSKVWCGAWKRTSLKFILCMSIFFSFHWKRCSNRCWFTLLSKAVCCSLMLLEIRSYYCPSFVAGFKLFSQSALFTSLIKDNYNDHFLWLF